MNPTVPDREPPGRPPWWFEVETAPLTGTSSANFRDVAVRGDGPHRRVLGPSVTSHLIGAVFAALGGVALLAGLARMPEEPGVAIFAGIGALFLAIGLLILLGRRRILFDRETGRLEIRSPWSPSSRPLAEIRAVQVIDGGVRSSDDDSYQTFQLNLVFKDDEGAWTRRNLSTHADREWSVAAGDRLAAFLGVPLLDGLRGIARAARPDDEAPFDPASPPFGVLTRRDDDRVILASHESFLPPESTRRRIGCLTRGCLILFVALAAFEVVTLWVWDVPFQFNGKPADKVFGTVFLVGFTAVWLGVMRFILGGMAEFGRTIRGGVPPSGWRIEAGPTEWLATTFDRGRPSTRRLPVQDVEQVELNPTCRLIALRGDRSSTLTPIIDPDAAVWLRRFLADRLAR